MDIRALESNASNGSLTFALSIWQSAWEESTTKPGQQRAAFALFWEPPRPVGLVRIQRVGPEMQFQRCGPPLPL